MWAAAAVLILLSLLGFLDLGAVADATFGWVVEQVTQFVDSLLPSTGDLFDYLNPF
jgi:hypothetical protein